MGFLRFMLIVNVRGSVEEALRAVGRAHGFFGHCLYIIPQRIVNASEKDGCAFLL